MDEKKQKVCDMVHKWCNEQYHEIPDMNRRALMDRILSLNLFDFKNECDHSYFHIGGNVFQCKTCGKQFAYRELDNPYY